MIAAASEPAVKAISKRLTSAVSMAMRRLLRHHRHKRSTDPAGRAMIGSPLRTAQVVSQVRGGGVARDDSLFIALRQIVSRSRGIASSNTRGDLGSSLKTC